MAFYKPRRRLSPDTQSAGALILDFPVPPELWEINFCCLQATQSVVLWYSGPYRLSQRALKWQWKLRCSCVKGTKPTRLQGHILQGSQAVRLKSVGSSGESKLTQQRSPAKAGKSPLKSVISSEYLILDHKYPREDLCNKDQFHSQT